MFENLKGRKVIFATPCYDGRVEMEYASSLVATSRMAAEIGVDLGYFMMQGMVVHSRNVFVTRAFNQGYDDLIFGDADQQWHPQWVFRLLSHPVDCVAMPVPRKGEQESYNIRQRDIFMQKDKATGLYEVEAAGTGFMRLSRRAMEVLVTKSPKYADRSGEVVAEACRFGAVYPQGNGPGELRSEDFYLCAMLRSNGISIHLDSDAQPRHIGRKAFDGKFDNWLHMNQQIAVKQRAAQTSQPVAARSDQVPSAASLDDRVTVEDVRRIDGAEKLNGSHNVKANVEAAQQDNRPNLLPPEASKAKSVSATKKGPGRASRSKSRARK